MVLLGLTATLQCRVSSDPTVPYKIEWYREGQATTPISNSQRVGVQSDGTLEIQAVRASDVGSYSCVVTSPGGNETRSARLSVIELPFPPTNVRAARLDDSQFGQQRIINVSWTPGFDGNSPISQFIIQRREVSELGKLFGLQTVFALILLPFHIVFYYQRKYFSNCINNVRKFTFSFAFTFYRPFLQSYQFDCFYWEFEL